MVAILPAGRRRVREAYGSAGRAVLPLAIEAKPLTVGNAGGDLDRHSPLALPETPASPKRSYRARLSSSYRTA